ncbi:MAG: UDP-2,3-diacylglucosamine diphosphatase LpxI [Rhizobiaceae bacterium]|nr:UDP-2,3-diacylglucosamine diphosphatase LpxI [Rhizobiaceae bacterium]
MSAVGSQVVGPSFPGEPLGVISGGGDLPRVVCEAAKAHGWEPTIVSIGDGIGLDWAPYASRPMPWGQLGNAFDHFQKSGVKRLVFCGTVSIRPDYRSILPSLRTIAMLPEIFRVIRGGDDTLLRAAAAAFEKRGFEVLAVQDIAPELLMPSGCLTRQSPSAVEDTAIARGIAAATALGALDVGQAVVASKDRVIALEGIEGTREMLQRVADLRRRGRVGPAERCVLVKGVKPDQDLRFDLPAIGISTIEEAAAAGLAGIALSAGHALVIRLEEVVAAAEISRLFIVGTTGDRQRGESLP